VRVNVERLKGVESVEVSLERATADIRLRAGNTVALSQIREVVKNNGFTAKEAVITVVGNLIERGGKPALNVTGTNTVMLLRADPKQPGAYAGLAARDPAGASTTLEVSGTVETHPEQPDVLLVRTVSAVAQ
jgi:hypothetical protein